MTDAERIRELSDVLRTLLAENFRGHTVGERLQFSPAGRELLRRATSAMHDPAMQCHYCGTTSDLRPYGPQGSMVCFGCAMSTPERKAETGRNFGAQLDACGPDAVIDGSGAGPYPAKHHHAAAEALRQLRATEP